MTRLTRDRQRAALLGLDRLHIFVPAIMGVGLLFWLSSEARDLLRSSDAASRNKRAAIAGRRLAADIVGDGGPATSWERGLRPRPVYVVTGLTLLVGATYVTIGSIANYVRDGGYLSDIAWLLALALSASAIAVRYGLVALSTAIHHPRPAAWTTRALARSPLTTRPVDADTNPEAQTAPWWLGTAAVATAAVAALLSLIVEASPHVIDGFDRRVAGWFDGVALDELSSATGALYSTPAVLVLAIVVGVASMRCRALTAAYVGATVGGLALSFTLRTLVTHDRPPTGSLAGGIDSFPSGHMIQAVILAALLPVGVGVLTHRPRLVFPARIVLGIAAAGTAVQRVAGGLHWPSDVLGGALIGATIALGAAWVLGQPRAHVRCQHTSVRSEAPTPPTGIVHLPDSTAAWVRATAHASAALVVVGLTAMTLAIGLPSNPDHYVFGSSIERPVQLALAGMVTIGSLVVWRWPAVGAVVIAFAASCLGLFASIEYPPHLAVALTAVVMIPAVLVWLSWQHRRRHFEIGTLAVVTTLLLGSTWVGATHVYDIYFGPTHPASTTPSLPVDRVEWVWAGGLGPHEITVTARLAEGHATASLVADAPDGTRATSATVEPDDHRLVRLHVSGLTAGRSYTYRVVVDGVADASRGVGTFRTPDVGPMSFRVAIGGCARTGSNGAVFDAIAAEDPLLYLMIGDAHYGNITSTDPADHLAAYDRMMTTPAQAALHRAVPTAYVWDDHDYGPNDAGASSPGRAAVGAAYRRAVPHYALPPDGEPIFQAFTIGRVRFVMTDPRSDADAATLLGATQRQWLIDELTTSSRTHALIVWINGVPWIGPASTGSDGWAGHAVERREIANAIAAAEIHNLVMVSGDAHMVAIDDGTNSDYASGGGAGFPVLHAAALDRPGSVKGGPYSDGAFPGGGQYGILDVADADDGVTVTLAGRRWDGTTIVEHRFEIPTID